MFKQEVKPVAIRNILNGIPCTEQWTDIESQIIPLKFLILQKCEGSLEI